MRKLSVIIPTYNEGKTIGQVLAKIADVTLPYSLEKEVIVVDDFSTDHTKVQVAAFIQENPLLEVKYFQHVKNMGKGAALHTGVKHASGEFLVVQDADLEYSPAEYPILLQPILEGHADVVYGSRFVGGKPHRVLFFWHTVGNCFLTLLSNLLTNLNLTDMEAGLKMFRTSYLKALSLKEKRFGFEPEVTAKISKIKGIRIYEVGISYYGRTYEDGKKVGWRDGVRAIYCIFKYNLFCPQIEIVLSDQKTERVPKVLQGGQDRPSGRSLR